MTASKKAEHRREEILNAVLKVVGAKGYEGVTMKSVAAEAGVSYGLLHYYFRNKEEMMVGAMRRSLAYMTELYAALLAGLQPGDDAPAIMVREFRRLAAENSDHFNIFLECWPLIRRGALETRDLGKELYDEFKRFLGRDLARLAELGVIDPVLPPASLATVIVAIFDGLEFQVETDPSLLEDDGLWDDVTLAIAPWLNAGS